MPQVNCSTPDTDYGFTDNWLTQKLKEIATCTFINLFVNKSEVMFDDAYILLRRGQFYRENNKGKLYKEPITMDADLAAIKDWLKKQPHLPDKCEDNWLLNFLRGCNYSLENCKHKLDMYFTMRTACPDFFCDRDILRPELLDMMTRAQNITMPGMTPEGWRVSAARGLTNDLETSQIGEVMKVAMMNCDLRMRDEQEVVTGDAYILDAISVKAHHLRKVSPSMLKKFFISVQEAYPVRVKQVHVVNASALMDALYTIVKPFLKEKIRKRIIFHKDYTTLFEYLPKYMVPQEYGGTGPSFEEMNKKWLQTYIENRQWFAKHELLKADESLRPGKPKTSDELFGIEGSFRQLAID